MTVVSSASTYNVHTATCWPICLNCNGVAAIFVEPVSVGVGSTAQAFADIELASGEVIATGGDWTMENNAIASVNASGVVSGYTAGSTVLFYTLFNAPPGVMECYYSEWDICPEGDWTGAGGVTVEETPSYAIVQSDIQGSSYPNGEPIRLVTYIVYNQDGSAATGMPIGENYSVSGWNCTSGPNNGSQPNPPLSTTVCDGSRSTDSTGSFQDGWGWYTAYGPAGCGLNITDHWQWCSPSGPNPAVTFMTLTGYMHTNATQIDGYAVPPSDGMPQGTKIGP
jgi:hypothetical protein